MLNQRYLDVRTLGAFIPHRSQNRNFLAFLSDVDGDDDNIFATNFLKVLSYLLLDTWYTKKERVDNNALHER